MALSSMTFVSVTMTMSGWWALREAWNSPSFDKIPKAFVSMRRSILGGCRALVGAIIVRIGYPAGVAAHQAGQHASHHATANQVTARQKNVCGGVTGVPAAAADRPRLALRI